MKRRLLSALIFASFLGLEIWIALYVHDRIVRPYLGDVLAVICIYFLTRVVAVRMRWLSIPVTLLLFAWKRCSLPGCRGYFRSRFRRLSEVLLIRRIFCVILRAGRYVSS